MGDYNARTARHFIKRPGFSNYAGELAKFAVANSVHKLLTFANR